MTRMSKANALGNSHIEKYVKNDLYDNFAHVSNIKLDNSSRPINVE